MGFKIGDATIIDDNFDMPSVRNVSANTITGDGRANANDLTNAIDSTEGKKILVSAYFDEFWLNRQNANRVSAVAPMRYIGAGTLATGDTVAGSDLRPCSFGGDWGSNSAADGTWKVTGITTGSSNTTSQFATAATTMVRIS